MADELTPGDGSAVFHCPWCSAVLPSDALETCPSCRATLTSTGEATLPGVTAIDHEALLRSTREVRQPRGRFLSWLSGDIVEGSSSAVDREALARPDAAVRAEMLRLQIEAELADRQAEADSIIADAVVDGRPTPNVAGDVDDEGTEAGSPDAGEDVSVDEETAPTAEADPTP